MIEKTGLRTPPPLSEAEAAARLKRFGPNESEPPRKRGIVQIVGATLKEPMFAMLLGAAFLYWLLGDFAEGALLVGGALLSVGLVIVQESRNENALAALRALAAPTARVLRAEGEKRIPAREIVPGDHVLIGEGERAPVDAIVIAGDVLTIDQSVLTGESAPVLAPPTQETVNPGFDPEPGTEAPFVFAGTMVVRGQATLLTSRTGPATRLGRIGQSLGAIPAEPTPLQRTMGRAVAWLGAAAIVFCGLVAIAYWFFRGDWIEAGLAGITLAISLTPEEFPMVLVVFLALGSWRLAHHNVLVRRSAVVETLGAVSMLCVDKTGTLTQNRMEVALLARTGSTWRAGDGAPSADLFNLLAVAVRACAVQASDPMDRALHRLAADRSCEPEPTASHATFPLRPNRLAFIHLWRDEDEFVAAAKGAPEAIFQLCRMDATQRAEAAREVEALAAQGLRVLAVASARTPDGDAFEPSDHAFAYEGLVAFRDPLRGDVREAIALARRAGVAVAMITGDHAATARAIAAEAGIDVEHGLLLGADIDEMTPAQLQARAADVRVFARIRPEQKLALVAAFRALGHVVAMTGDGVNDAPALNAAHVGIAMGQRGADVAREAADIVLLDDSFASIVGGVRLGRRIFANLRKALVYICAIHVPVAGLALAPILMGLPPILFPAHVMLLELVIDPVCALVFEGEPSDRRAMDRAPRPPAEALFGLRHIALGLGEGVVLFGCVYALYLVALRAPLPADQARALAFVCLSLGNLVLALGAAIEPGTSLFDKRRSVFWTIAAVDSFILVLIVGAPPLAALFRFEPPTTAWLAVALATAVVGGGWSGLVRIVRARFRPSAA
jgi:Ca2+-transporting ATPase